MRIGLSEILLIIIVALALLNPEKLGDYAKTFGKVIKGLKENQEDIQKNVVDPITEPLKEAVKPVTDIKDSVNESINEINNIVKGGEDK